MSTPEEPIPDDILDALLSGKTVMQIRPLTHVNVSRIPPTTAEPEAQIFLRLEARSISEDQAQIFEAALTREQAKSVVRGLQAALRRL